MKRHTQLPLPVHFARPCWDLPALSVADHGNFGIVDHNNIRIARPDHCNERFRSVGWREADVYLQKPIRSSNRDDRQSGKRLLALALSVEPERPTGRDQTAHTAEKAEEAYPGRVQPCAQLRHFQSPVGCDDSTVNPSEGA